MNARRIAASLLLGIVLAACANGPGAPTPPGSPAPTPSPTASPSPPPGAVPSPTALPTAEPEPSIVAIGAGSRHTCAVASGGGVKCWGADAGRLGDGLTIETGVPVDVPGLATGVRSVVGGEDYSCALTESGGVKCWGGNQYGQLGDGSTDDRAVPVDVVDLATGVTAIAAGVDHTCALMRAGGVRCWGSNHAGELGDGSTDDRTIPVDVAGLAGRVVAITAGYEYTCALLDGGAVQCWGSGDTGSQVDVAGLAAGTVADADSHTCGITSSGGVWCRGYNSNGELGDGTTADRDDPVDVIGLASGVRAVAAGTDHTCALMDGGGVRCWGSNEIGQLGNDSMANSSVPVEVGFAGREPVVDASGAIVHATGATDVLLRYDHGPDVDQPGPEFTLYGDGTIIFRDETATVASPDGPIVRASRFSVGRLTEDRVQSLLRFALTEGGLRIARSDYETGGEGCIPPFSGTWVYTLRAGGIDRRAESRGCEDTFGLVARRLRSVAESVSAEAWSPGAYVGSLLEAKALVEDGWLPKVPDDALPWPWPGLEPDAFDWRVDADRGEREGRRVLTADEAAVFGLSDDGGVVQRANLLGPDGTTVYVLSMRPALPDETD